MTQQEVSSLLDKIPENVRYSWFFLRREGEEIWYSFKDETLNRRLKEINYPKTLKELKPRERNALEADLWETLKRKFG